MKVTRTQPGYGVKCDRCGKWLTKWDWSEAEALEIAKAEHHECK